jgi:hypothetical protein
MDTITSNIEPILVCNVIYDLILIENIIIYVSDTHMYLYDITTGQEYKVSHYPIKYSSNIKYKFIVVNHTYYLHCSEHNLFCIDYSLCDHSKDEYYEIVIINDNNNEIYFYPIMNIPDNKISRSYNDLILICDHDKYTVYANEDENKLVITHQYQPLLFNNNNLISISKKNYFTYLKPDRDTIVFLYWCLQNIHVYIPNKIKIMIIHHVIE